MASFVQQRNKLKILSFIFLSFFTAFYLPVYIIKMNIDSSQTDPKPNENRENELQVADRANVTREEQQLLHDHMVNTITKG